MSTDCLLVKLTCSPVICATLCVPNVFDSHPDCIRQVCPIIIELQTSKPFNTENIDQSSFFLNL